MQKQDFETYQKCFRDFAILPKFSETHVFRGTIRHPSYSRSKDQRRNIFKKASVIPTAPTITTTTHKYIQLQREKIKKNRNNKEKVRSGFTPHFICLCIRHIINMLPLHGYMKHCHIALII